MHVWKIASLFLLAQAAPTPYIDEVWRVEANAKHEEKSLRGKFAAAGDMSVYTSHPKDAAVKVPSPPSKGYPVIVVAHHAVGIYHATFLREFTDRLAAAGYIALLPDFFHRTWSESVRTGRDAPFSDMNIQALLKSLNDDDIIQDLTDVKSLVSENSERWQADAFKMGIVGFCMGGRIAWLAAVTPAFAGHFRAAVAYHGGNVFKTWPAGGPASKAPGAHLGSLICPVMGHFGSVDQNPSPQDMVELERLSLTSGQEVTFHKYDGADHGFSCKDSAKYQEDAAEEAWPRTLEFFGRMTSGRKKDEL